MSLDFLTTNDNPIGLLTNNVVGSGGVAGNLQTNSEPLGVQDALFDPTTLGGNILGESGVVDDLSSGDNQVSEVADDVFAPGGVVNNLGDGDGIGQGALLDPATALGNVLGDDGLVEDALSLVG
jgi:hypothetical protein